MEEYLRVSGLCRQGILHNISFSVKKGEMAAIMGPSGSGKSTLLYHVSGMDRPDAGEVWLGDMELTKLTEEEKARLRLTRMGFVFQHMNMLSNLTILENILLPSSYADKSRAFRAGQRQKALHLMEKLGIGGLENRKLSEVSGGQLQRACICRSILMDPEILFADEPTGALHQAAAREVMDSFLTIHQGGTAILMVTHDSGIAARCERILYLLDGVIRGELSLGAYEEAEAEKREQKTAAWLREMGW